MKDKKKEINDRWIEEVGKGMRKRWQEIESWSRRKCKRYLEKILYYGEFIQISNPWAGLIASRGSFYPMVLIFLPPPYTSSLYFSPSSYLWYSSSLIFYLFLAFSMSSLYLSYSLLLYLLWTIIIWYYGTIR